MAQDRSKRRHRVQRRSLVGGAVSAFGPSGDPHQLPSVFTDPGCDAESHPFEVMGAAMAWSQGARWRGRQKMDCGCELWIDEAWF